MNNFTGFVLIGGKSSRMGADKFALEINGETFLERAVNTLKPNCESVKIVVNQTQNIETSQPIIRDIFTERGALGGIHAALKNCETKFAVILAVDLPFVTTEVIGKLANYAHSSNQNISFVPRQIDGRPQPLCAVYCVKECLPMIEKLLNEKKSVSVRDFLELIATRFIEIKDLSEDDKILFNVNYLTDYQQIN
jgi:molybdopterin-guanine dinucleotide biosynthesis protein A